MTPWPLAARPAGGDIAGRAQPPPDASPVPRDARCARSSARSPCATATGPAPDRVTLVIRTGTLVSTVPHSKSSAFPQAAIKTGGCDARNAGPGDAGADAGRRPHAGRDPRRRHVRVRRARLPRFARRRDRRPDPHDQADDLLPLRREEAAVHRRARAGLHPYPGGRAEGERRRPRSGRGGAPRRRGDLRSSRRASRVHPVGQHREHPQRRARQGTGRPGGPRRPGGLAPGRHPAPRSRARGLPVGCRRDRRPHDDQRVLCVPAGQPPHLRHHFRPRPGRPVTYGPLPDDVRRHDRPLSRGRPPPA